MKNQITFLNFLLRTFIFCLLALTSTHTSWALPAFAMREKVSCVMCHTNGSAPHLTPYGYLYRRAGFRPPQNIGNKEADEKAMTIQDHLAAGTNVTYQVETVTSPAASNATVVANQFNVPELELWPLVGGYFGNFGVWSELDAQPSVAGNGGGVALSQGDLRYVTGTADFFFNFRIGLMAAEGFGASDQWFDDSNIPVMDRTSANLNMDTLVTPFGAMKQPELGAEFGVNYLDTHFTFGVFNGFTGIGSGPGQSGTLTPALMNEKNGFSKDYKLQLDQFIGNLGAITVAFYHGAIPLNDPTGVAFTWIDHFDAARLYLTYFALPGTLDVVGGAGFASHQYVTVSATPTGNFNSRGGFLGALYYVIPHLTAGARFDYSEYAQTNTSAPGIADGYSIQVSLPYENNIFIVSFNRTLSEQPNANLIQGVDTSLKSVWRFLL